MSHSPCAPTPSPATSTRARAHRPRLAVVSRGPRPRLLAGLLASTAILAACLPATASADATGIVSGRVTYVGVTSFTIQTPGRRVGVVDALTAAANRITRRDYPYVYGGGHAQAGTASVGMRGPGYNGRRVGFDCSGAVAAVLAAGGLWPAGSGVPNDAGIIATLLRERLIARGVGTGPVQVTLYDRPGVHIFMNIDGRFFGTSDGAGGGDPRGGAGWLDDGAPDAARRVYRAYHLLPRVLRQSASSGHIVSFQSAALPALVAGLQVGEPLRVSYSEARTRALVASAIAFPGALTATGTVVSVAPDGSSLTLQASDGTQLTLDTSAISGLVQGVAAGESVQVSYVSSGGLLLGRDVVVLAGGQPSPTNSGGGPGAGDGWTRGEWPAG